MIYLVAMWGYEGIENLIWAGTDKDEAIRVTKLHKDKARPMTYEERQIHYEKMDKAIDNLPVDSNGLVLHDTPEYLLLLEEADNDYRANQICVQGFDGKEFKCVCKELDFD